MDGKKGAKRALGPVGPSRVKYAPIPTLPAFQFEFPKTYPPCEFLKGFFNKKRSKILKYQWYKKSPFILRSVTDIFFLFSSPGDDVSDKISGQIVGHLFHIFLAFPEGGRHRITKMTPFSLNTLKSAEFNALEC